MADRPTMDQLLRGGKVTGSRMFGPSAAEQTAEAVAEVEGKRAKMIEGLTSGDAETVERLTNGGDVDGDVAETTPRTSFDAGARGSYSPPPKTMNDLFRESVNR